MLFIELFIYLFAYYISFKTREGALYQEHRDVVTINEWTDRIYQNTPLEHIITNVVSGRKMRIQKYNLVDTGKWKLHILKKWSGSINFKYKYKII